MLSNNDLEAIRKEIDRIDADITKLLEKRMDHVRNVLTYKKKVGMAVLDSSREQKILDGILSEVKNPDYRDAVKSIYKVILKASRDFQRERMESDTKTLCGRFGLIGKKLSHSLSPRIHSFMFDELGIPAIYDLIEVQPEHLPDLLKDLKSKGYLGVNVTIPYKKDIMEHLDSLSDEAIHIGAVNTIRLDDGIKGYNTDYDGFGMALEEAGIMPIGLKSAILGSGGAARAVVAYLEDHGAAEITIVSRDPDAVMLKFPGLSCIDNASFRALGYDLVINATPVGMYPEIFDSPLGKEQLDGAGFVMDLIYNPAKTLLLKYAEALGIPHTNGLFMLVAQAFHAEEIWLGKKLDRDLIQKVMDEIGENL